MIDDFDLQAEVFSRYLVNAEPGGLAKRLYADRVGNSASPVSAADEKLLGFALRHPWSVGYIDGGLALTNPESEIRKRIYLMFGILETSPELWQDFMGADRGPLYLLAIGAYGLRAAFRALAGCMLVLIVRAL